MMQKWIAELPEKTGKSLDQWVQVVKRHGPAREKERREWLKKEHGFGSNAAWWIAERSVGGDKGINEEDPEACLQAAEQYVAAMLAGAREGLKPIYDALLELCLSMAPDVKACPCQTIGACSRATRSCTKRNYPGREPNSGCCVHDWRSAAAIGPTATCRPTATRWNSNSRLSGNCARSVSRIRATLRSS